MEQDIPSEGTASGVRAPSEDRVHGLVDHLFRRQAGRLVASLVRSFGPAHLDLAEEVVQEALVRALKRWPFHGVPDEPAAWLHRVAKNLALDRLRRGRTFADKEPAIRQRLESNVGQAPDDVHLAGEIDDDQLRLIFLCSHPELPRDARVALTLKSVGGFSVPEIARAFLVGEATIAQRLVRAKRRIRELCLPFEVPKPSEIDRRRSSVLEVVYLMFNEGYAAHAGERLIRGDLVDEALRLVVELSRHAFTRSPAVDALAALLFFQASRLPARLDAAGDLVVLAEQDRGLWDRRLIARAFYHLERSAAGEVLSTYHVQATIAAHHAASPSSEATDWPAILALYDELLELDPSPVVALNRAVAVARCRGPRAGLEAVDRVADHPAIADYYLLPATRAELLADLGDIEAAAAAYRRALDGPVSVPERRFLERKLEALECGE